MLVDSNILIYAPNRDTLSCGGLLLTMRLPCRLSAT